MQAETLLVGRIEYESTSIQEPREKGMQDLRWHQGATLKMTLNMKLLKLEAEQHYFGKSKRPRRGHEVSLPGTGLFIVTSY